MPINPVLTANRPGRTSAGRTLARVLGCLLTLVALPCAVEAQTREGVRLAVGDTLWEVHLAAGEAYVGRVVEAEGDTLTLETVSGTRIRFGRDQVVRARPARGALRGGTYWPADPNSTRLFFSPTGRSLEAGDGYVGVYELFIPFVAYGVTDAFMLAGGSPFYLALGGDVTPPLYFGPKLRVVDAEKVDASLGALAVVVPEDDDTYNLGIVYGAATWGDADRALSVGLGWGYVEGLIADRPLVMAGGEMRVSRRVKLITENLFVPGEAGVIASAGLRLFGERLAADAGLVTMLGEGDTFWLPVVNFVYNFGPAR